MRRPILLAVFPLVLGMIFTAIQGQNFNGYYFVLFLGIITFIAFVVVKVFSEFVDPKLWIKRISWVLLFIIIGSGLFIQESNRDYYLNNFNDETVTLVGNVIFAENKSADLYYLTIMVKEAHGQLLRKPEKILAKVYGELSDFQDLVGRRIEIRGKLEVPSSARNPKCFDYQKYLRTKRIGSIISVNSRFIEDKAWKEGIISLGWKSMNKVSLIKWEFLNSMSEKISSKEMGLLKGMLFGDKNDIDSDLMLQFQGNSTAHILAVSGLHVGIVYLLLQGIFRKRNALYFDVIVIIFLIIYAFMSAFAPSIIRAVFMIGLHIIAKRFHFRYDLLSATAFTGGIILIFNPMMLLNAGFQLSYTALLSMSFLIPFFVHHFPISYLKPFFPLIAIQIGLIPIIIFHFNKLSFVGIIANIPTIFLAGLIIPLLVIMFPLNFLLGEIFMNVIARSAEWLIELIIYINELIYFQGKFSTLMPSPPFWLVILFYGMMFFLSSELLAIWKERKCLMKTLSALLLILIISGLCGAIQENKFEDTQIIFLDVGQGDCLFMETPTGKTVMIDSGGSSFYDVGNKILLPFLLKNGYRELDLAVVSHLHQDHYGGFKTLSGEIAIGALVLYEGYEEQTEKILSQSGFTEEKLIFASKGDVIKIDESVSIKMLCPEEWKEENIYRPEDENQMSLVMMVIYDGLRVLMTGDIGQKGENDLIEGVNKTNELECHVLKIPHHGSKYSTGNNFLEYTNPSLAVIQVGKNNFGHPSLSTLEKCRERDIMVLRNDWHGAVGIQVENWDGKNIWTKTMITVE